MTVAERRDHEATRARELKAYVLLYLAAAGRAVRRPADNSFADLCVVLDSVSFPKREISPHRKEVAGYSSRHDALWLRPHLLQVGNEAQKLFDPDRTIFRRIQLAADQFSRLKNLTIGTTILHVERALSGEALAAYKRIVGRRFRERAPYLGNVLIGRDPTRRAERGVVWLGVRPWAWMAKTTQPVQAFWLRHDLGIFYCTGDPFDLPYMMGMRRRIPNPEEYLNKMPADIFAKFLSFVVGDASYYLVDCKEMHKSTDNLEKNYLEILRRFLNVRTAYLSTRPASTSDDASRERYQELEKELATKLRRVPTRPKRMDTSSMIMCTSFRFEDIVRVLPNALRAIDRIDKLRIVVFDVQHLIAYAEYLDPYFWLHEPRVLGFVLDRRDPNDSSLWNYVK